MIVALHSIGCIWRCGTLSHPLNAPHRCRCLCISLPAALLLSAASPALAADAPSSSSDSSISFTFVGKEVKEKMEQRDSAMEFQCKHGMFDCEWTQILIVIVAAYLWYPVHSLI